MFSVITCSIDAKRFAGVKEMYERNFKDQDWELIRIDDAKSLAEGYTRGLAKSRGDQLIFSHDDIDIFSPDLPQRLKTHLSNFDVIGLAGTSRLIGPDWIWAGPPYIFGQVCSPHPTGRISVNIMGAPRPVVGNIQAIDGLFMAARRSVFSKISFDAATFDGFFLYDLDFSYRAYSSGLKVAVANDICALHASPGNFGETWNVYAEKFHLKWLNNRTRMKRRPFAGTVVVVADRAEAMEVMTPAYWADQSPENGK
jgi:Glycosyltransferase like family